MLILASAAPIQVSSKGGGNSSVPGKSNFSGWQRGSLPLHLASKIDPKILDSAYLNEYLGKYAEVLGVEERYAGLLVRVDNLDRALDDLRALVQEYGGSIGKIYSYLNLVSVKIPADTPEVVERFAVKAALEDEVSMVWLDDVLKLNTTLFDTAVILGFADLHGAGINGTGVKVAVLDTGIDDTHPELAGSVVAWADFINGITTPYDDHGHGTFVSGIIAARGVASWLNGEGAWHSVNFDNSSEFNYPGVANLTYAVNVAAYQGQFLGINYTHLYWIESYHDYGYVYYRFDTTSWTQLANYTGADMWPADEVSHNISVPAGASILYLSFIYQPDDSFQWGGWWLDDIKIYNATNNNGTIIFMDDVEGPMPPEVVEHTLWSRTGTRMRGVAPGASLMGAKVCDAGGSCPFSAILDGIEWATLGPDYTPGTGDEADIISMSIGGPALTYDPLMQAVDWAYSMNVTVIVAAGNSGPGYKTVESPAAAHGAIAVGASTKVGTIAGFSSLGPSPVDYTMKPDIVAPGRHIISTYKTDGTGTYRVAIGSGTSFSTPHVSGLAALIKQAHPAWTPEEVRSALVSTATQHLTPSMYSFYTMNPYIEGGGLPNVSRAINTEFLPVPALISFGMFWNVPTVLSANVSLNWYGVAPGPNVEVLDVELWDVDGNNYDAWVVSPVAGSVYSSGDLMPIEIDVPGTAPPNMYWGRIQLNVSNEFYQVIFGFTVAPNITISGHVYDVNTGLPIQGAVVNATDPYLGIVYASNISDAAGYFELQTRGGIYLRLTATMAGYYMYISTILNSDTDFHFDIYMTPIYGYNPLHVLVVKDTAFGAWEGSDYQPEPEILLALNNTLGITMRLWNNTVQGVAYSAILSGDFPVVAWFSGGIWSPVNDPLDQVALVVFQVSSIGSGIMLEGGDVGWWHVRDSLMWHVAHAFFDNDLAPGAYGVNLTRPHPVTWTLPPTFTIDSTYKGWPDSVYPVNGGFDLANWSDPTYMSAIVAYEGRPLMPRTIYFAFPLGAIVDMGVRDTLAYRALLWLFDQGPPVYPGTSINVTMNRLDPSTIQVIASWIDFTDPPFNVVHYNVYLNGTPIATGLTAPGIDLTSFVEPGKTYNLTIQAYDLLGENTNISTLFTVIPPTLQGGGFGYLAPGTYVETLPIGRGMWLTTGVLQPFAGVQAVEIPFSAAPPTEEFVLEAFDLKTFNPGNIDNITIALVYHLRSPWLNESAIKPYWWDGSSWRLFTAYTVDPATDTITLFINGTTSPTPADLQGTPVIIAGRLLVVGASVKPAEPSTSSLTPIMVSVAAAMISLAVIGIAVRRRALH